MNKIILGIILSILFSTISTAETLPAQLISMQSATGSQLLQKNMTPDSIDLLAHFTTQKTPTYCGIASAVMVLNASNITRPSDSSHPGFYYFDQDNFFTQDVKSILQPKDVLEKGVTLDQLAKAIALHGLKTNILYADQLNEQRLREKLKESLQHHHWVLINFYRPALNQSGGGHVSPLAAYDPDTDQFLMLDVARYKYPAFWVKTSDLWNAIHTIDHDAKKYRGLIILSLTH
jgi:hypothetical protein